MRRRYYLNLLLGIVILILAIICGTSVSSDIVSAARDSQTNIAVETEGNRVFNCMNSILEEDLESENPIFLGFIANYGGGIIEDDHLTIFVKDEMINQSFFDQKMSEKGLRPDQYDIEIVNYSYSDLESQIATFWNFRNERLYENAEWASLLYSVAICQEHNCITVFASDNLLIEVYPDLQNQLNSMSYEIVYLEEEPITTEETTTLKPGYALGTTGSLGFRCKLNGNKGFVTTVHTANYSSFNPVTYAYDIIGNITAASYGASADFCFVELTNSNYSLSRTTYTSPSYTLHASSFVVALPTNYTVYLVGKNSTSARQGSVIYYSSSVNGLLGTDWLICDYSSAQGDSGGCIFAVVNGDNCVVGIHDGTAATNRKYGTKYTTMTSILSGLTIY